MQCNKRKTKNTLQVSKCLASKYFHLDTLLERHDPVTQGSNARVCTTFRIFKKRFSRVWEHLLEITPGILLLFWMIVVQDTVEE